MYLVHTYVVSGNLPFSTKALLILLMSALFPKIIDFREKQYLYSKQQCESCVRSILVLFSFFVRLKVTFNGNVNFKDCASGILLSVGSKLIINWKNNNGITICCHDVIVKRFLRFFVCLVKLSQWSKFHVYIITGSGVMIIFFYKVLLRNPEIENTPV